MSDDSSPGSGSRGESTARDTAADGTPSGTESTADRTPSGTESTQDAESAVGSETSRHARLTAHPTPGAGNSLSRWPEAKSPLRVTVTVAVVWVIRYSPSLRLKRWLLRRLGATVGAGVALALTATPDVFFPELLTIRTDAIVGYDATLLCHEFLQEEYRTGEIVVGERAMIGAGALVLPGVEIGADARVAANSLVTEDVPPGVTVAGVPATPVKGDSDG